MKLCPKCGEQAQNNARFCKNCAYSFSASDVDATLQMGHPPATMQQCTNCGSPVVPGSRMCTNCAAPLAGAAVPGAGYVYGQRSRPVFSGPNRKNVLIASIVGGALLLTGLIIMIVLLASGSGPGSVVKDIIYAIEKNDDNKVYDSAAKNIRDASGRDGFKVFTNNLNRAVKDKKGISSVSIKKEDIDNADKTRASVDYEVVYGDKDSGRGIATLTKEDGRWKVLSLGAPGW